jgi:major outer membrane protein
MNWNLNSKIGQAALSLVAFTGVVNAASDDAQMRNFENRLTALEQKKGAGGVINPSARPVVKNGVDIFVTGEVLVWKAHQDEMSYAAKVDSIPVRNAPQSGAISNWKGKWGTGFRLGIGYDMEHDGWDVDLYWTRYYQTSRRHTTGNRHGIFQPLFQLTQESGSALLYTTEAHDKKWKLRLDMIDLEMGREFFVSKWLTIRPHVGLRNIWVRQKFRVEYEGGSYGSGPINSYLSGGTAAYVNFKNNFWGIGLRSGLDSQWGLGCGLSIYAKLAFSLLWGQMKETETQTVISSTDDTSLVGDKGRDIFHICRPVTDMALGLRYDTTFSDDSYALGVFAGWEHHYFWSQNRLIFERNGDLSTSGVHAGLSFDF